jgi:hypothetical protein
MATTTPNFGWSVPTSSDLVKNGATAIETLGDSIDASLVDLKGGTTGQVLAKATNTDMDFTWTTAGGGGSSNVAGKNGVLNSNFSIWQRGTSISTTSAGYSADRWYAQTAANGTVSRQVTGDTTNLPFIQYCARVQRTAAATTVTDYAINQSFESVNSIPFAGKSVSFSFYARRGANFSSASNVLNVALVSGTGTDQNLVSGYTGQATAVNSTATLTTTWQRFTYTGTVATTATELAVNFYYTSSGTAGAADYYEVTGVQVEIAASASAYSPNTSTQALELAACQRYFYMLANGNGKVIGTAFAYSATQIGVVVNLPVQLRTDATLISTTGTDYYGFYRNSGTDLLNSFTLGTSGNIAVELYNNSNISSTAGDAGMVFTNNASASIALSAEL